MKVKIKMEMKKLRANNGTEKKRGKNK